MAITNAQQYKQLFAKGGRIGLKGGADASTASFGKSVGYSGPSRDDPKGGFDLSGGQGPTFDGAPASQLSQDVINREKKYKDFIQAYNKKPPFVGPVVSVLRNIVPGNRKLRSQFINQQLQNERIKDFYENLSEEEQDNFNVMQGLAEVGYDQYAADMGSPGLLYSGDVGGLEMYVAERDPITGKPTKYGYNERREGRRDEPILPLTPYQQNVAQQEEVDPNSLEGLLANRGMAYRFMADGGRIGYQIGGLGSLYGSNTGGQKPIYPRISDIEASLSGAEQRIGDPSLSSFGASSGGVSDGGFGSPMGGVYNQPTGGEQPLPRDPVPIPGNIDYRPGYGPRPSPIPDIQQPGIQQPGIQQPVKPLSGIGGIQMPQVDPNRDYGFNQYGFDSNLLNYLNRQKQASFIDAGASYSYDPTNQTFSGGTMVAQYGNIPLSVLQQVATSGDRNLLQQYQIGGRGFNQPSGGRAGFAEGGMPYEGGIMDLESARQMYGLGKLVKKATGAIKKIVKSPVGKAALLYFGGNALMNKSGGLGIKDFLTRSFLGKEVSGGDPSGRGRTGGIFQFMKDNPLLTIAGGSTLAGLLASQDEEDEVQPYYRGPGLDIDAIRRDPYGTKGSAYGFYAEGGNVKEPVAKDTMPLLDMNGMEKDYRADGGFVPIGRMERADDVPARLSKNEFVFTADAVRNAGDGDIDKGAEVMYNVMKNLEAGGDISEESQGLNGAREMFQTSKRLEEVL
jgi:hypothetical protein